jgi:hypothetical protein
MIFNLTVNNTSAYDDSDGDGISDDVEITTGTYHDDADSDDDGILDGQEKDWNLDTDLDGYINGRDPDSDNDGILDGTESGIGIEDIHPDTDITVGNFRIDEDNTTITDPTNNDTDGDGLLDGDEDKNHDGEFDIEEGETDPLYPDNIPDTTKSYDDDNDGMPDGWEIKYELDPLDPTDAGLDLDGDDLSNLGEYLNSTDPQNPDTDKDNLPDGWEVTYSFDPVQTSNSQLDPDYDGFTNLEEFGNQTDPLDPNSFPEKKDPDSDNDGLPDSWELSYFGNLINEPHEDTDKDGYTNQAEYNYYTDPADPYSNPITKYEKYSDIDNDEILDLWEIKFNFDITDPIDAKYDSDSDGYSNYAEFKKGTNPRNKNDNPDDYFDNDNDQLPDTWEEFYGLSATYKYDNNEDLDRDGYSNLDEYWAGTDPSNDQSYPIREVNNNDDGLSSENFLYLIIGMVLIFFCILILFFVFFSRKNDQNKYSKITEKPHVQRKYPGNLKPFQKYNIEPRSKIVSFDRNCIYCGTKLKFVKTNYGPQFWCQSCNKYS